MLEEAAVPVVRVLKPGDDLQSAMNPLPEFGVEIALPPGVYVIQAPIDLSTTRVAFRALPPQ